MKDRIVALLGGLAALYVFVVVFIHPPGSGEVESSNATTEDRGSLGYKSLYTWLSQSNIPVYRLRKRYNALDQTKDVAKTGNLLIVTLPQVTRVRDNELGSLHEWVHRGNNLLLMMALSDFRPRAQGYANYFAHNRFLRGFGFSLYGSAFGNEEDLKKFVNESKKDNKKNLEKDKVVSLVPVGTSDIAHGVKQVYATTPGLFSPSYKLASTPFNRASLRLLQKKEKKETAIWEIRDGHSRVWISQFAYLFSNKDLAHEDNARLIANIINASLEPGGKVIFDDMHQGLTELYDEGAFFHDSRLHNTAWFIFAFWVLYVIGHTNRISPIERRPAPARAADFVIATANLFARRLNSIASARLLYSQFFDWIRLRYGLPTNGQPIWQILEHTERIDKVDLDLLKKNYLKVESNRKVNLTRLANRMQKIRSTIS